MNVKLNTAPESSHYSAKNMSKPVHFYYVNRNAKSVSLIGDFNNWSPGAHPMRRQPDGSWFIETPLSHGHHRYLFLVDEVPTLDPNAIGTVQASTFSKVSVIAVS